VDEEQVYLDAIVANPEDDQPRLALAAWLEGQADEAQRARGEFIRVQCERARLPDGDARREELERRERTLKGTHERTWLGELAAMVGWWSFHRGLVWLNPRKGICNERTLRELIAQLACSSAWRWVDGLDLRYNGIGPEGARALAGSPHQDRKTTLDLPTK
jgi:uncharacterized protein (TIGR02996 family)